MLSSNAFLEELKIFHWLFDNIYLYVESASKYVARKIEFKTIMNISGSRIIHTVIVSLIDLVGV